MLDYTSEMTRLIADIAARCPEFAHVDVSRILISFSHARVSGPSGQFAKIAPMRFRDGKRSITIRNRRYTMPKLQHKGRDVLYVIYFCMPKFQNLPFRDKLITVFHELYHVSPEFNGDIRRFSGRNYAHGPSRQKYNEAVSALADRYLAEAGDSPVLEFLRMDFTELQQRYGEIVGLKVTHPKPQPSP